MFNRAQIDFCKKSLGLNYFDLVVSPDFSSRVNNNRSLLREALYQHLSGLKSNINKNELCDLAKLPQIDGLDVSISHCPLAGGFALVSTPNKIGFDIEVAARVSEKQVARICAATENEWRQQTLLLQTPALIWVAKEAVFKSLYYSGQPQVLSEIGLCGWSQIENNALSYRAMLSQNSEILQGRGTVTINKDMAAGFFSLFL